MSHNEDIRWKQRFDNYTKALASLSDAVELSKERELTILEKQGLIQAFEFTFELAWNVMKDFLKDQGIQDIYGSKGAIQQAFKTELISDGETWMQLFEDRNKSSHTYNQEVANEIVEHILELAYPLFIEFENKMRLLL